MMLNELITANYGIKINKLNLVDSYLGTEIYLAESDDGRYIVKLLPLSVIGCCRSRCLSVKRSDCMTFAERPLLVTA